MEQCQVIGVKVPHGMAKVIAQKCGKSEGYTSQVLAGKYFNREILIMAAKILNNDRRQMQRVIRRLENDIA